MSLGRRAPGGSDARSVTRSAVAQISDELPGLLVQTVTEVVRQKFAVDFDAAQRLLQVMTC